MGPRGNFLGSTSSQHPGLLYSDSLCVDPEAYASDMGCERYLPSELSFHGFDLVNILLRSARAGQSGRDRLKRWFKDFRLLNDIGWGDSHYLPQIYISRRELKERETKKHVAENYNLDDYEEEANETEEGGVEEYSQDGPGMYRMLHPQMIFHYGTLATTYEQRAWVFLDDARFYPSPSANARSHFPTEEEALDERFKTIQKDEDCWDHPWQARARHQSQKWHNEMSPTNTKPEDYQDSELEEEYLGSARMGLVHFEDGKVLFYPYTPSKAAGVIFLVLFAGDTFGHLGRAWAGSAPLSPKPFMLQLMLILVAPVFISATIYVNLGRLKEALLGHQRRKCSPTSIFILTDIIAFCTQIGGSLVQVIANPKIMEIGGHVVLGGLLFQLFVLVVYFTLVLRFQRATQRETIYVQHWRRYVWTLIISVVAIWVRNLVRAAEFAEGWYGCACPAGSIVVTLDSPSEDWCVPTYQRAALAIAEGRTNRLASDLPDRVDMAITEEPQRYPCKTQENLDAELLSPEVVKQGKKPEGTHDDAIVVGVGTQVPRWDVVKQAPCVLRYFVRNDTFPSENYAKKASEAFQKAAVRWMEMDFGVTIEATTDIANAHFDLRYWDPPNPRDKTLAQAFFPNENDQTVWVYDSALSNPQNAKYLVSIFAHEIGHILGLRHEFAIKGDNKIGRAPEGFGATQFKEENYDSVMGYNFPPRIQKTDTEGIKAFYKLENGTKIGDLPVTDYLPTIIKADD
ncbi:hypothetical protein CFIO01_03269 [Colletotrichum fioriniae PJ7]|uniref:Peptidase metallopeptidase domain-containing protein n=1 Tax=Colletotrichum fioriniae PJ7 TaxID=1445577 RepID=A0A010SJZ6_9PEZI|nr:hypothetical protein CFIO01_03269 [Colletotrichum fioriniae PJ7]